MVTRSSIWVTKDYSAPFRMKVRPQIHDVQYFYADVKALSAKLKTLSQAERLEYLARERDEVERELMEQDLCWSFLEESEIYWESDEDSDEDGEPEGK
ncbi:hypothetical protein AAF712_014454 [Marasmius tenuissimus]|uniref:Uncharacterized protein n=1 Tax=Marasmius tenuissimus TaxID=585030 RepID=A0ABR2ZC63_9AGAR